MQKYVVKNCPALYSEYFCSQPIEVTCCEDYTDCLIKQVIEKCKEAISTYDNEEFYEDDCDRFLGESAFAQEILELFEVENDRKNNRKEKRVC